MAYKLGVLVIHGIGDQKEDFADGLIREVASRLDARADQVFWKPVWWAPIAKLEEARLIDRLSQGSDLDYRRLRRFVVHILGDAVAYQRVPGENAEAALYVRIHALITEKLRALRDAMPGTGAQTPPLMVVAHSLGGHIMSNYIWDQQHPAEQRAADLGDPFMRTETLAGMFTFGCNIPLFALALPTMVPIRFPGNQLTEGQKAAAQWLNLYDPDDVLGFPLAPLSDSYAKIVTDRAVNVGGVLTMWNPLSHNAYWTDNDVTKPLTAMIEQLLDA